MKITFTEKVLNYHTGWSEYRRGDQADLRHGQALVNAGQATPGWVRLGFLPGSKGLVTVSAPKETVGLDNLSNKELRDLLRARQQWQRGMKRDEMIALLSEEQHGS